MQISQDFTTASIAAQLINNLTVPVCLTDLDGTILAVNPAFCAMFDWSKHASLGDQLHDLCPDAQIRAVKDALTQSTEPGPKPTTILCDGCVLQFSPLAGTGQKPQLILIQHQSQDGAKVADRALGVTQRVETYAQSADLSDQERRWHTAGELSKLGLWDHNLATNDRYLSRSWRQLRGYTDHEVVPDDHEAWIKSLHPEDRNTVLEELDKLSRGDTDTINYNYREKHRDGHWLWILSRGRVMTRDTNGLPWRVIGLDTDISDVKRKEQEFSDVSHRLEISLAASRIGIWEYNVATDTVSWDDRMREIYGIAPSPAPLPRDVWENALHPDDRDWVLAATEEARKNLSMFAAEYRVIRANGAVAFVRAQAHYLQDETSGLKLIGINWDVTQDHLRAEELCNAHTLLKKQNDALAQAHKRMEHSALHDELTGLANRRKLDLMQQEYIKAGRDIVILHLDLDRFKQINDTLGHAAGDQVLIHIADLLRHQMPKDAIVARVGGDEFVVCLPKVLPKSKLIEIAQRFIAKVEEPFQVAGQICRLGISIGVAIGQSGMESVTSLLESADIALYRAKNTGRNRVCFFSVVMKKEALEKRQCADDILAGLDQGEFTCVYQPQFSARSLDLTGIEALARWQHPKHGLLTPDRFLAVAEDLDVVARIDGIVMTKALEDMDKWRKDGHDIPRISVNVSAKRLADPLLIPSLEKFKFKRGSLAFELLESILLDSPDEVLTRNLRGLRRLGIGVEIDDFGTGHASVVGMLQMNPDRIKIDRQLVAPIVESRRQLVLVKSIIEIGKLQGIGVVAEGVETDAHIAALQALGCDYLQGYGLARPMPFDAISTLLVTQSWRHGREIASEISQVFRGHARFSA